jgi:hypothetical protein
VRERIQDHVSCTLLHFQSLRPPLKVELSSYVFEPLYVLCYQSVARLSLNVVQRHYVLVLDFNLVQEFSDLPSE